MSERITQELRDAMNVDREYTMGGDVVTRTYCMGRDEFADLCDAIDAVHNGLERENDRLKCELDRVLGELDEMHKTDGLSDNSGGFMHNEKRSIGSAVVTITPTLDWMGVARELRAIADTLAGDAK